MKITQVVFAKGLSSFFFDDQKSIKNGAIQDGFVYKGNAVTPGFKSIRQAGECISVLLKLENGLIAVGDCTAVQYSGAGGRDPLFTSSKFIPFMEQHLTPLLLGRDVTNFLENTRYFDNLKIEGNILHTAIRYGLSQALLDAAALATNRLKVEVLCNTYDLPIIAKPIPLFGQSGDDRYAAVDKMVLKKCDALPHALINNIPNKLGYQGEKLHEYISWAAKRITQLRQTPDYQPDLHIDVYGTIGMIWDYDVDKIVDYLATLQNAAGEFSLSIEGPIDMGEKIRQIEVLHSITNSLDKKGITVKLVADEWCNTYQDIVDFTDAKCCHMVQIKTPDLGSIHNIVEAIIYCNNKNMLAYQGGSCNETDVTARTCVHIAMAARPMRMLVKPGMGFDEGMNVVFNEMHRSIALLQTDENMQKMNTGEVFYSKRNTIHPSYVDV